MSRPRTTGCAPSRTLALALALGSPLLAGCPEPPPPPEPCAGPGDPELTLSNRRAPVDLAAGGEVEVFPPPQGGVFAELDVNITDMALEELEYLRIAVDSPTTGEQFALVRYFGNSIPLRCDESTDVLELDNVPVGFVEMYTLDDLDGLAAVVTGVLETTSGDFDVRYEVMLRRTDY